MGLKWLVTASLLTSCALAGETAETRIQLAREMLQSAETQFGPDHPATAMMVRELALSFETGGYHEQAERYARQALTTLEKLFGDNDRTLVPVLNVLAEACAAEGRTSEALQIERRAIAIGPAAGAHYGTALHNAAALLFREGKAAESAELFERALAAREATLPSGHPYIEATRAELKRARKAAERRSPTP
jgi:tetratricopeptide (TPR) repeat protein